jgi:squalene-hopene/tetraprenyl-beta-curcumene cyclase
MRILILLLLATPLSAAELAKPAKTSPKEPIASHFDAIAAANYLDGVSLYWTRERKCAACHTNVPYMLARPMLKVGDEKPLKEIRTFMEETVDAWKTRKPRADYEVFATAFGLAAHDSVSTGKLHEKTKAALDKSWSMQKENGSFNWPKCNWPPLEHDDYMGVVFLGLATAIAPENYAKSTTAQAGLTKLKEYLVKNPAPDLHHRTMLLWLSLKLDGFQTKAQQEATIQELLQKQQSDGGWSLASMGTYIRHDKTANPADAPSDGYATGFAVYVLRQAGKNVNDPIIQKGKDWLLKNQRESGRWFTRSLSTDGPHLITNAGSAFAVLGLASCEVPMGK